MAATEKNILQVGQAGQTQQTKKTEQTQATEQFPTPGERNQTFEFLAVIGILFVIMGHTDYDTFPLMNTWFPPYSFHMALFVFVSGYFYKEKNHESLHQISVYLKKKFLHLILPALLWNIIYGMLVYVLSFKDFTIGELPTLKTLFLRPFLDNNQFVFNMGAWFVVSLFFTQIFYVFIRFLLKCIKKELQSSLSCEIILFVITLLGGIFVLQLRLLGFESPLFLALLKISFFLPFFLFGRLYQILLEKHDTLHHFAYFAILLMIQAVLLSTCERLDYVLANATQIENGPVIPFLSAFIGIAFYLRIAKILSVGIGKSKYITLISSNSYAIMIHQFFGFMVAKGILSLLQHFFGFFPDFSISVMKQNIWYYYFPNNIAAFGLYYILAGIFIPIVIQTIQTRLFKFFFRR